VPRPGSDDADLVDIVCFDKLAAAWGEYLTKGREVASPHPTETRGFQWGPRKSGRLHLKEWSSREGERRSRLQVVADAVQFLDPPKKTGDPDGAVAEPADKPAVGAYRSRRAS